MEVKFDTSQLLLQLQAFEKEATRRMEKMVEGFAYHMAKRAIFNTPLGDASNIINLGYYEQRFANTGLLIDEGLARGNWQFSKDASFQFVGNYGQDSDIQAARNVESQSKAYKLGETFYIGNSAPYIGALERGYSKQALNGIVQPTMDDIKGLYAFDFQNHYKRG